MEGQRERKGGGREEGKEEGRRDWDGKREEGRRREDERELKEKGRQRKRRKGKGKGRLGKEIKLVAPLYIPVIS